MTDANNPAAPENYRPHPQGYACRDCGAASSVGVAVRHSWLCDLAPRQHVLPEDQAEGGYLPSHRKANQEAQRKRPSIDVAAKRGELALHYQEDEIQYAVRTGQISESDALNQDF